MATMRVAQVSRPNGPFEVVERQIPEPGAGAVRIRVHACGICHSDSFTKEGTYPGIAYPRVPGHEVAGMIELIWNIGFDQFRQKGQRLLPTETASLGRNDVREPFLHDVQLRPAEHLLQGDRRLHLAR